MNPIRSLVSGTLCIALLSIFSLLIVYPQQSTSLEEDTAVVTTFAAIGDFGVDNDAHAYVADMIQTWNVDFVITQGDNRYDTWNFDEVIGQHYCPFLSNIPSGLYCSGNGSNNRFFPAIGNHEYTDGAGLDEYLSYFSLPGDGVESSNSSGNERYYDFVIGDVHIFVINSDGREVDGNSRNSIQAMWLKEQLALSTASWKIVTMHHSPFSSALAHGSKSKLQWPYAAWGADAVISGHDHVYERLEVSEMTYFVNGLGGRSMRSFGAPIDGSQVRFNDAFGAMRITAVSDQITFEFLSISDGANGSNGGNLVDSLTLSRQTPVIPTITPDPSLTHSFALPIILSQQN